MILALCSDEGCKPKDLFRVCKEVLTLKNSPSMATALIGAGYLKYYDGRLTATPQAIDMLNALHEQSRLLQELQTLARLSNASGASIRVIIGYAEQIQSVLGA